VISVKAPGEEAQPERNSTLARRIGAKPSGSWEGLWDTKTRDFWCEHRSLGRKHFRPGEILPRHGLALFDTDLESAVDVDSAQLDSLG